MLRDRLNMELFRARRKCMKNRRFRWRNSAVFHGFASGGHATTPKWVCFVISGVVVLNSHENRRIYAGFE